MFSISQRGDGRRFGALIRSLEIPNKVEVEGICLCVAPLSLQGRRKAQRGAPQRLLYVHRAGRKAVLRASFDAANAFTWAAIKNKARVQIRKEKS